MKLKKWVSALLCGLVMAGTMTGCMGNLYENVCTIDGTEVSSGLYMMAQLNAVSELRAKLNAYDSEVGETLKAKVDGVSGTDFVKQRTEELCRRYIAVQRICRERGITLSDASLQNVQQSLSSWDWVAEYYAANGIAKKTAERYYNNQELSKQLFAELYGEGGEFAVTDQALKDGYAEKFAHILYASVPANSKEEGVDVSAEVDAKVEEILEKLRGGMTPEQVAEKEFPALYALVGQEYDTSAADTKFSPSYMAYEQPDAETYSPEFLEGLRAQAIGDYGTFRLGDSIMIYRKIPVFETEQDFKDMRDTVLSSVMSEAYEDYLRSVYEPYEVDWRFGARWFFRPSKIEL